MQLEARGVRPAELQATVLSRLHKDHAGGLKELVDAAPGFPVYVSREHRFYAAVEGCAPAHWPRDFHPTILHPVERAVGPWTASYPLAKDGKVIAVDIPGHVPGHISLVVYEDHDNDAEKQTIYFLTGDATYGIDLLEVEQPDGLNSNPDRALQSLRLIKEFARRMEVVLLPSHDVNTPRLLGDKVVYRPS